VSWPRFDTHGRRVQTKSEVLRLHCGLLGFEFVTPWWWKPTIRRMIIIQNSRSTNVQNTRFHNPGRLNVRKYKVLYRTDRWNLPGKTKTTQTPVTLKKSIWSTAVDYFRLRLHRKSMSAKSSSREHNRTRWNRTNLYETTKPLTIQTK
jgi:hypothetical protein